MASLSDEDIIRQHQEARLAWRASRKIVDACYDQSDGRIHVEFDNQTAFAFNPRLIEGLADAPAEDLVAFEVTDLMDSLEWPARDVQVEIAAVMAGVFGSRAWMRSLLDRSA